MSSHTITAHIVVRDAARAADWYTNVLGAEERLRIPVPDGRLMSVELRLGDSAVMLADEFPEMGIVSPQTLGGTYMALHLLVDDVDKVWQRALDAGAEVFRPLQDSFWGERAGQVIDPFGHRWALAQQLREVSPEELVRAAQEMFATANQGRKRSANVNSDADVYDGGSTRPAVVDDFEGHSRTLGQATSP